MNNTCAHDFFITVPSPPTLLEMEGEFTIGGKLRQLSVSWQEVCAKVYVQALGNIAHEFKGLL